MVSSETTLFKTRLDSVEDRRSGKSRYYRSFGLPLPLVWGKRRYPRPDVQQTPRSAATKCHYGGTYGDKSRQQSFSLIDELFGYNENSQTLLRLGPSLNLAGT